MNSSDNVATRVQELRRVLEILPTRLFEDLVAAAAAARRDHWLGANPRIAADLLPKIKS